MTTSSNIVLEAEQLQLHAVSPRLTLQIPSASTTVITGPANSGKSAWLELLAALRLPAGGRLRVLQTEVPSRGTHTLRTRLGYASHDAPLLSHLDARMNVMLPLLYHTQETSADARRKADALLDQFEMDASREQLPAQLNPRERSRVQLARALAMDPAIVFVDEPFSLEWKNEWQALEELLRRQVADKGRTFVIITNQMEFAASHANQLVLITRNEARVHDSWESFAKDEAVAASRLLRLPTMSPESRT